MYTSCVYPKSQSLFFLQIYVCGKREGVGWVGEVLCVC